eukprot:gene15165-21236_t
MPGMSMPIEMWNKRASTCPCAASSSTSAFLRSRAPKAPIPPPHGASHASLSRDLTARHHLGLKTGLAKRGRGSLLAASSSHDSQPPVEASRDAGSHTSSKPSTDAPRTSAPWENNPEGALSKKSQTQSGSYNSQPRQGQSGSSHQRQGRNYNSQQKQGPTAISPPSQRSNASSQQKQGPTASSPPSQRSNASSQQKQGPTASSPPSQRSNASSQQKQGPTASSPPSQRSNASSQQKQGPTASSSPSQRSNASSPRGQGPNASSPPSQRSNASSPRGQGPTASSPPRQDSNATSPRGQGLSASSQKWQPRHQTPSISSKAPVSAVKGPTPQRSTSRPPSTAPPPEVGPSEQSPGSIFEASVSSVEGPTPPPPAISSPSTAPPPDAVPSAQSPGSSSEASVSVLEGPPSPPPASSSPPTAPPPDAVPSAQSPGSSSKVSVPPVKEPTPSPPAISSPSTAPPPDAVPSAQSPGSSSKASVSSVEGPPSPPPAISSPQTAASPDAAPSAQSLGSSSKASVPAVKGPTPPPPASSSPPTAPPPVAVPSAQSPGSSSEASVPPVKEPTPPPPAISSPSTAHPPDAIPAAQSPGSSSKESVSSLKGSHSPPPASSSLPTAPPPDASPSVQSPGSGFEASESSLKGPPAPLPASSSPSTAPPPDASPSVQSPGSSSKASVPAVKGPTPPPPASSSPPTSPPPDAGLSAQSPGSSSKASASSLKGPSSPPPASNSPPTARPPDAKSHTQDTDSHTSRKPSTYDFNPEFIIHLAPWEVTPSAQTPGSRYKAFTRPTPQPSAISETRDKAYWAAKHQEQKADDKLAQMLKENFKPLGPTELDLFDKRHINMESLNRCGVKVETVGDPKEKQDTLALAFPYFQEGRLVNVLYRSMSSGTSWLADEAKPIALGYDDVLDHEEFIIVESEIDKLTFEAIGIRNVMCFPGAVSRPPPGDASSARGFVINPQLDTFLWNSRELFQHAKRIILAMGNDSPGEALADELACRIGRDRCWIVQWPKDRLNEAFAGQPSNSLGAGLNKDFAGQPGNSLDAGSDFPAPALPSQDLLPDHSAALASTNPDGLTWTNGTALASSHTFPFHDFGTGRSHTANDVLSLFGKAELLHMVTTATPCPVNGVFQFNDYSGAIWDYYNQVHPEQKGVSTGWPSLDTLYKVVPGELTIITGVPNSGKSEWIDALLMNLAKELGWCFGYCSMEKPPVNHARQLLEKCLELPFFEQGRQRMGWTDVKNGLAFINDHFRIIRKPDQDPPTIDYVLAKAKILVFRHGIRGLVIDPYNELDHSRPSHISETEYVSGMLGKVKRFAQLYSVHVWFVAHPRQMQGWQGQAPSLYDISGSAHFINKADNGIVVHRPWNLSQEEGMSKKGDPGKVDILIRKVRNKEAGQIGDASLFYNITTGCYKDPLLEPEAEAYDV